MTRFFPTSKTKRLTLQGLLAVSVVGLGVAAVVTQIDSSNPAVAAQAEAAEAPAEGLEMAVYSNAMRVRREAGLRDRDLAALGMDESETTAALERLVEWCQTNEKALQRSSQQVYRAERELHDQQRLVRIGQADEGQLKDARGKAKAVRKAKQSHEALIDSGAAYAMQAPGIASNKADRWRRSAELKGEVDSDLRYLPGMDSRRLEDLTVQSKQQKTKREEALTYREGQALKAVREQVKDSLPGVRKAVEVAMPLPMELRLVPEELLLEDEDLESEE